MLDLKSPSQLSPRTWSWAELKEFVKSSTYGTCVLIWYLPVLYSTCKWYLHNCVSHIQSCSWWRQLMLEELVSLAGSGKWVWCPFFHALFSGKRKKKKLASDLRVSLFDIQPSQNQVLPAWWLLLLTVQLPCVHSCHIFLTELYIALMIRMNNPRIY